MPKRPRRGAHPLRLWLTKIGFRDDDFAKLVGVANGTVVYRWTRGAIPSPEHMHEIERLTQGQVQIRDFYDHAEPRQQQRIASRP
jgi:DNA-binding transcriptional regulator YdaS (Cro superfamily)